MHQFFFQGGGVQGSIGNQIQDLGFAKQALVLLNYIPSPALILKLCWTYMSPGELTKAEFYQNPIPGIVYCSLGQNPMRLKVSALA